MQNNQVELKKCSRCNELKPLNEYHNRVASLDGKDGTCKDCRNKYNNQPLSLEESMDKFAIPAREILEAIGYSTDGPISVYEQFKMRIKDKYGVTFKD